MTYPDLVPMIVSLTEDFIDLYLMKRMLLGMTPAASDQGN